MHGDYREPASRNILKINLQYGSNTASFSYSIEHKDTPLFTESF